MILLDRYNSIMAKPEEHRNRWALGLASSLTALILVSFAFYKGYFHVNLGIKHQAQVANVVAAEKMPSPVENTKKDFEEAFGKIKEQYNDLKTSLENVIVPFITGIDVYERK